jgi:HAD superfamily hydrolase (TIGR01509 family)
MVQLHQKVRARGLPTWIFSNTNELAVEHIRRAFAFFRQFEGYIYSYTEGCMKPEPGMYEALEARSGCAGAEIVYIDDRPENIATAAARGWRGLVHETPVKTIAQVLALVDGPTPGV